MKHSFFTRFMSGSAARAIAAGDTPPRAAAGEDDGQADAPLATADEIDAGLAAAFEAGKTEGNTAGAIAGATAERERTAAVFTSDAGKANMAMAAWMLSSSPAATSESIIGQLAQMPQGAAPAAAAAAAAPITTPLAHTPKIDLGGGQGAASGAEEGVDKAAAADLWAESNAEIAQGAGYRPLSGSASITAPGAMNGQPGGAAVAHVAPVAVPPTGY